MESTCRLFKTEVVTVSSGLSVFFYINTFIFIFSL